ncbi:hypothetical protein PVAP13_8KG094700 [Panicum virgatum]|uniref:Uncharacterized protein n=1 Tax=Panicum virgatum TaxID=38727 RepID=A0A8T0PKI0_PANVG|nr:hypothetical protein PVAP13_8KG094700 [Panicum virgatum]
MLPMVWRVFFFHHEGHLPARAYPPNPARQSRCRHPLLSFRVSHLQAAAPPSQHAPRDQGHAAAGALRDRAWRERQPGPLPTSRVVRPGPALRLLLVLRRQGHRGQAPSRRRRRGPPAAQARRPSRSTTRSRPSRPPAARARRSRRSTTRRRWLARTARRRRRHPPAPPSSEQRAAAASGADTISKRWRRRRCRSSTSSSSTRRPPVNPCRCPTSPFLFLFWFYSCAYISCSALSAISLD